jgi:DNA segregation ATPase FtsK/SpoIIIE, S-DNA-T family
VSIEYDDTTPETGSANGHETVAFSDMTRPLIPRQTTPDTAADTGQAPAPEDDTAEPDVSDTAPEDEFEDDDTEAEDDDEEEVPGLVALLWAAVKAAGAHPGTRGAIRQGAYLTGGASVLTRNAWEARTTAVHSKMIRGAVARGDYEGALEWEERARRFRADRHDRRLALLFAPLYVARAVAISALVGAGVLLTVGIALAVGSHDPRETLAPFLVLVDVVRTVVDLLRILWGPALLAGMAAGVAGLWRTGRNRASMPGWLATAGSGEVDMEIDETTIGGALKALNLKPINDYLKQGLPLQYLTTARAEGRGTRAVLRLPAGVTAEKIARRRADLATGLYRAAKEVWPTTGSEAGILDLWVADKGALAEGAGPYPLLADGVVDVFKGVPFGKTLRGDPLVAPLIERNSITGGMPGQGKSSAARVIMAGAALDPTAELRIYVPDSNFDFEAFAPRCSDYVMGAEDEKIEAILHGLRKLHAEIQHRGKLLIKYEEPSVTRRLASANVGLHPLFVLLEEAHVAIQHPKYGKEISQLLIDSVKLGRKRAAHLLVSTQAPTKDSMPRDVTRNCSNGIAFAVGDHVANDGLLGQGAYKAGHRATELIPGVDKGVAVVKGFTGERSDIVQTYFLDISKKNDQVTPLIRRSLAEIDKLGLAIPGTGPKPKTEPVDAVDPLGDIAKVLTGEPRMNTAEVIRRLITLNPGAYKDWTNRDLKRVLAEHDAEPYKSHGQMVVGAELVYAALSRREDNPGEPDDE